MQREITRLRQAIRHEKAVHKTYHQSHPRVYATGVSDEVEKKIRKNREGTNTFWRRRSVQEDETNSFWWEEMEPVISDRFQRGRRVC